MKGSSCEEGEGLRWWDEHDPALGKTVIGFGFVCVRSLQKRLASSGNVRRVEPGNGSIWRNSARSRKPASEFSSMAVASFLPLLSRRYSDATERFSLWVQTKATINTQEPFQHPGCEFSQEKDLGVTVP